MASTTDSTSSAEGAQTPTTMGSTRSSPGGEHEDNMSPPDNRMSHLDSPIVRVLVDTKPFTKEFFVHENLICSRSEFFEKAVRGEWKESEERKVSLPEDEPSVFLTYLHILYAGDTLEMVDAPEWETISKPLLQSDLFVHMCRVYVLAGKLMDKSTRVIIWSRLKYLSEDYRSIKECPSLEAIQVIYNGTPSGDPIREELILIYAEWDDTDIFGGIFDDDNNVVKLPSEFLLHLARHLAILCPTNSQLKKATERCNADRHKILDLTEQLAKLDTSHKETQARLESMTKAFEDMKAQRNDAKAKVKAKNEELMSKDEVIIYKDQVIIDKDQVIIDKDQVIRDKDQVIRDKDNNISNKASWIRVRDSIINRNDEIINGKNKTIEWKDQVIQEGKVELARALQQAETYKLVLDKLLAATATRK